MQELSAAAHTHEAEARRIHSLEHHRFENAAQEELRGRLRDTSILDSSRVHFETVHPYAAPASSTSVAGRADPDPLDGPERLRVLDQRLAENHPYRYATEEWKAWRDASFVLLRGYYPNTTLPEVYGWLVTHSHMTGERRLSAAAIWESVKRAYPRTEISSVQEMRKVMKCLTIFWSNLHSGYYIRVHQRRDVKLHRSLYLNFALLCHDNHKVFFVVGDGSFIYENATAEHGWCARAEKDSDLTDSKPGKGRRLNVIEFMTVRGLLRHPDGNSAGTLFLPNAIESSKEFLIALERGCVAIQAAAVAAGCEVSVLLLDGARTQTTMPEDAINPNDMNLNDGGKNRNPMRTIGLKGCKTVLQEERKWPAEGLSLADCRHLLWQWRRVLNQLTAAEALCRRYKIILLYNPKGHPVLNPIEEFWRLVKDALQDILDLPSIRAAYLEIVERFMAGGQKEREQCDHWFARSRKYVQYYGSGGQEFVRRSEMTDKLLDRQGPMRARAARLKRLEALAEEIHDANIILLQGKHYPDNPKPWGRD